MIIVHAFLHRMFVQDIVLIVFGKKPVVSPTKLELSVQ